MHLTDKPKRNPDATYEMVNGKMIIMDESAGGCYALNDTGAMFWNLLDGERTIGECARLMAVEYDEHAGIIEADLIEMASAIVEEGLIIL